MKIGDMVRVQYQDKTGLTDQDSWHYGIIIETPDDGKNTMWKMWCGERETAHILAPHLDKIKVISEE